MAYKLAKAWRARFIAAFNMCEAQLEELEHRQQEIERLWKLYREHHHELQRAYAAVGAERMAGSGGNLETAIMLLDDERSKLKAEVIAHEDRQALVWQLGREMRAELAGMKAGSYPSSMLERLHDHYREALELAGGLVTKLVAEQHLAAGGWLGFADSLLRRCADDPTYLERSDRGGYWYRLPKPFSLETAVDYYELLSISTAEGGAA